MAVRHRTMRQEDVGECIESVRAHPILGPRQGNAIEHLSAVCIRILGREAFRAVVFEDAKDSQVRRVGAGVSVFVSDDFLVELKTPPFFWVGPELIRRIIRGNSPLLSDKEMRQANANGGLNLLAWIAALDAEHLGPAVANPPTSSPFSTAPPGFPFKDLLRLRLRF